MITSPSFTSPTSHTLIVSDEEPRLTSFLTGWSIYQHINDSAVHLKGERRDSARALHPVNLLTTMLTAAVIPGLTRSIRISQFHSNGEIDHALVGCASLRHFHNMAMILLAQNRVKRQGDWLIRDTLLMSTSDTCTSTSRLDKLSRRKAVAPAAI